MAKSVKSVVSSTPSLAASKRAARKPSPVVVVTPATGLASVAAALSTPAVPAPQPAPVVAVRGGLAIASVKLSGKPYRVGVSHNATWWSQVTQAVQAGGGQASVADLVKAGVPAIFVGYVVRRGYATAA